MAVGRDEDESEYLVEPGGIPEVRMVDDEYGEGDHEIDDIACERDAQQGKDRSLGKGLEHELEWMETECRGCVQLGVGMMDPVKTPEYRYPVVEPVSHIAIEIAKKDAGNESCRGGKRQPMHQSEPRSVCVYDRGCDHTAERRIENKGHEYIAQVMPFLLFSLTALPDIGESRFQRHEERQPCDNDQGRDLFQSFDDICHVNCFQCKSGNSR